MIVIQSLLHTRGLTSFSNIWWCYLVCMRHEGRLPCGSTIIVIKLLTGVWWPCGLLNYLMRWSALNECRLLGEILLLLCGGLVGFSINWFCTLLWIRECTFTGCSGNSASYERPCGTQWFDGVICCEWVNAPVSYQLWLWLKVSFLLEALSAFQLFNAVNEWRLLCIN